MNLIKAFLSKLEQSLSSLEQPTVHSAEEINNIIKENAATLKKLKETLTSKQPLVTELEQHKNDKAKQLAHLEKEIDHLLSTGHESKALLKSEQSATLSVALEAIEAQYHDLTSLIEKTKQAIERSEHALIEAQRERLIQTNIDGVSQINLAVAGHLQQTGQPLVTASCIKDKGLTRHKTTKNSQPSWCNGTMHSIAQNTEVKTIRQLMQPKT
ncbi:hypothetical protein H0A36_20305 [Endozoicomonas sp. SM1973]|uniref:Uncharacterized protein n=1 Tax=Spartinivicinus marinus TaxID=2994442 RepID=A0A853IE85_9GAMM|nr:hypothetical protein [Spartinivicinus marinus]MCX4028011.1 hypothetical protein [Spartinivicinus marinus]NYZ68364.1 hypothetical protein [Spartinivicinus marinus]